MNFQNHWKKLHMLRRQYSMMVFMLATIALLGLLMANRADALYILTGASDSAIVLDSSADEQSVQSFSSQLVYVGTRTSGFEITLKAGQNVSVSYNGATVMAPSQGENISSLLNRLHIIPSPLDMVLVDLSDKTGAHLTVASDLTYYDKAVESVAHQTVRVSTPDLPQGTEQVVQEGKDGTRTAVYEVVYSGGELVSRQFVEETDSTAVDEIIHVGTAVSAVDSGDRIASVTKTADGSGVLTFQSGGTMKFSSVKSMTATAYTAGSGGADHCTATGTTCRIGTVAVDRKVIPLGTKMYILTNDGAVVYGVAVAEDTGVRGNIVDLYYNTYTQCINFGRRACTVYLLGS